MNRPTALSVAKMKCRPSCCVLEQSSSFMLDTLLPVTHDERTNSMLNSMFV